jgi:heme/copper-type cytochrome/quinol oxidase subunit 2
LVLVVRQIRVLILYLALLLQLGVVLAVLVVLLKVLAVLAQDNNNQQMVKELQGKEMLEVLVLPTTIRVAVVVQEQ